MYRWPSGSVPAIGWPLVTSRRPPGGASVIAITSFTPSLIARTRPLPAGNDCARRSMNPEGSWSQSASASPPTSAETTEGASDAREVADAGGASPRATT
jgi:hypothetical protein